MAKKRRHKTKRKRLAWIRCLKNQFLCVCLFRHKVRGRDLGGYRVVRILRALYDRKLRTVVKVVVRTYGGDSHRYYGWNGVILTLEDRREFNGSCRGIEVGKRTVQIDEFVRDRAFWVIEAASCRQERDAMRRNVFTDPALTRKGETPERTEEAEAVQADAPAARKPRRPPPEDTPEPRLPRKPPPARAAPPEDTLEREADTEIEAEAAAQQDDPPPRRKPAQKHLAPADDYAGEIPPLNQWQGEKFSSSLILELQLLLKAKPELLVHRGRFKHDPGWYLDLPDGSSLELAGYGPQGPENEPVTATCLLITAWQEANAHRTSYGGSCMPVAKVAALVQKLCKQHAKEIKPKAVPPSPPKVNKDDDYFDV